MIRWLLAWMEMNYQEAYWESVALNQWWLALLMQMTHREEE
jgi:hypothetical protein